MVYPLLRIFYCNSDVITQFVLREVLIFTPTLFWGSSVIIHFVLKEFCCSSDGFIHLLLMEFCCNFDGPTQFLTGVDPVYIKCDWFGRFPHHAFSRCPLTRIGPMCGQLPPPLSGLWFHSQWGRAMLRFVLCVCMGGWAGVFVSMYINCICLEHISLYVYLGASEKVF